LQRRVKERECQTARPVATFRFIAERSERGGKE
jgi:hypothetical protein